MSIHCGKCGAPIVMGRCTHCEKDLIPKNLRDNELPIPRGPAGPSLTAFAEQRRLEHQPKSTGKEE